MTHRRRPNDRLRSLLKEADWTQEALARAVNTLGAEIGCPLRYDRTAVAHWLSGTRPRHPVPQLAAEALSRRIGRPVTPEAAGFPVPWREPVGEDPVTGFAALCRSDADAGSRPALQQRPYRVADARAPSPPPVPEIPAQPHPARLRPARPAPARTPAPAPTGVAARGGSGSPDTGTAPAARPGRTEPPACPDGPDRQGRHDRQGRPAAPPAPPAGPGSSEISALHEAARFFAASIDTHGGRHARSALSTYLADDVAPLLTSPRPSPVRREMLGAAARLAFLLGRMYEDGQLHGLAQRYYCYAHRLASEGGDRATWSLVIRAMSAQAQRLGHLPSALQMAEAAARAAQGLAPAQQAYVQAQLAVVLARTGERRGALNALATAERAAERSASGPGSSPFDSYPRAALLFQTSQVLEALGDLSGAIGALRRSVAERADADVRGRTLTHARFGQMLLRTGHLDEACAAWRRFLTGRERLRSGDAERALREMRRALRPYRNRRCAAELLALSVPLTEHG
ncbi:hypothetical protein [Streptomyces sp. YIM 98790]|uniref:hypothetical protein n=1 Tax=Streptomyces sp. YIM 98790 TaxID=2689077 RepID=UPI00140E467F|nr:hypothetical protein [Streptomyces sp. YIM 98790]